MEFKYKIENKTTEEYFDVYLNIGFDIFTERQKFECIRVTQVTDGITNQYWTLYQKNPSNDLMDKYYVTKGESRHKDLERQYNIWKRKQKLTRICQ